MFYNVPHVTIFSNTFHHIVGEVFIIGEVYSIVGEVLIVVGEVCIIDEVYSIVVEVYSIVVEVCIISVICSFHSRKIVLI